MAFNFGVFSERISWRNGIDYRPEDWWTIVIVPIFILALAVNANATPITAAEARQLAKQKEQEAKQYFFEQTYEQIRAAAKMGLESTSLDGPCFMYSEQRKTLVEMGYTMRDIKSHGEGRCFISWDK